jgi:meiotic recombination protein SPO11
MSGSKAMSYDSASLTTPDIKWLGVRPSDLDRYKIPQQCRLPLSDADIKYGKELLEEDFIKKNPEWRAELEDMMKRKEKAEIRKREHRQNKSEKSKNMKREFTCVFMPFLFLSAEALSTFGFQYLTQVFLPLKLQTGDWL